MRVERMDGIASARRGRSIEENLEWFEKMKQGTDEVGLHWLKSRDCVAAYARKFRSIVQIRHSETLSFIDAMLSLITALGLHGVYIPLTTLLALLLTPSKVLRMLWEPSNIGTGIRNTGGCWSVSIFQKFKFGISPDWILLGHSLANVSCNGS